MSTVIQVEQLSKQYRLGTIGGATLREDVHRWLAKLRGKTDPYQSVEHAQLDHPSGNILALDDVSFTVNDGDILGIIGENGAGKSTLLKILSRITAPTSGRINIKGRVGSLLEVGTGFHPELTGRENVYLNGAILGMTKKEIASKLDEIIEFAEMARFIDTPVKRYSSGMAVRLAFSVAAHLEPEILIVDEVLAVGDLAFQEKCLGKMKDISSHGRTVLFVSHNLAAVQSLCTRAIWLSRGKVIESGDTKTIVGHYFQNNTDDNTPSTNHLYQKDLADDQKLAITSIQLFDQNRSPCRFARTWEPLRIRIGYTSKIDVSTASIDLKITSTTGENVVYTSTKPDHNFSMGISQGSGHVDCVIESWPFNDGVWILSAGVAIPNVRLLCWHENLCKLTTVGKDVYNSGSIQPLSRSLLALPHHWEGQ